MLLHGVPFEFLCGLWSVVAALSGVGLWACLRVRLRGRTSELMPILVFTTFLAAVVAFVFVDRDSFQCPDVSLLLLAPLVSNGLAMLLWWLAGPERGAAGEE